MAITRPLSDIRFLLAEMVRYGADRFELEHLFARELADDDDSRESVHEKITKPLNRNGFRGDHHDTPMNIAGNRHWQGALADLTTEQRRFADDVINSLNGAGSQLMFLQGSAGTGKTFTVSALHGSTRSARWAEHA